MLSHPMTRPHRALLIATLLAATAGGVAACGEESIDVPSDQRNAAALFVERCSGCHTLKVAGTQGSSTNVRTREYKDGPNFNQRHESKNCVLYAIRNGGFSSGPMPQDIVTGSSADRVAKFVAKYAGNEAQRTVQPTQPKVQGNQGNGPAG
jgi:mono/diheme cytochrome c family protein